MSDAVPPGQEDPDAHLPSGLRRSTFTPPPAESPTWDDDALAAVMEAEVRPYTSPITLPVLTPEPIRASAPESEPEPAPPVVPEPAPVPAPAPAREPAPGPDHIAIDPFSSPSADDEQFARDLAGAPTLDAMRRLEDELRRRTAEAEPSTVAPSGPSFFAGSPPVSPEPPGPDPAEAAVAAEPGTRAEPESEPDPWSAAPPPSYTPPPLVEPPVPVEPTLPAARLLPPPTDLPDIALRAELPPPPGYAEDGTPALLGPAGPDPAPTAVDWDGLLASVPDPATVATVAPVPPVPVVAPPSPSADDAEDDDVIDPSDRADPAIAGAVPVTGIPVAEAPPAAAPVAEVPVQEFAPARPAPAPVVADERADGVEPRLPRAGVVETAGVEPTPREQRAGRAARLFWLWFAANASVVSVALGAVMLGTGLSLRQAIVATVVGIALSFIPLGFTTLAGMRSGQPTLVLSRSAFGTSGNVLPTVLAVIVRVFWGGVLLWLLGDALGSTLVRAHADAGLGATRWALIGAAIGLVLTVIVAAVGYGLLARAQLALSIVTGLLIVAAAAVTLPKVHLDVALTRQDGSWVLVIGGAVLVFAFVGLVWAFSGSDVARYQRVGGSGASSMLWATFGATIPPFLIIVWGALLAASNPSLATGFARHPLGTIAGLLPSGYAVPLLLAAVAGLLSGATLTLYSGGFALQSLTPQVPRVVGVIVAAVLALAAAAGLVLLGADTRTVVRDLAVTLAVPVAAWAGIFAAETMIRTRRLHSPSLLASGGLYPRVRWANLVGLIVISLIGYAFVESTAAWLGWEGFGWRVLGVGSSQPIARVDLGVVVALLLGILLPIVTAVPAIRRQEAADPGAAAART